MRPDDELDKDVDLLAASYHVGRDEARRDLEIVAAWTGTEAQLAELLARLHG